MGRLNMRKVLPFVCALGRLVPAAASTQRHGELDAINRLIDRYGALEDAMDMNAQAQLMSADRVWIVQAAGRRTDQAANMRIQQAAFDQLKKRLPGVQTFTEDRDRLIKLYGNGAVAVASFFRYTTAILPPPTSPKDAQATERPVASVTLTPELATLFVAGTLKLSARLRDANGALLTGRPITWASDDAAVATVDPDGTVQGAGPGSAAVTATSEGVSGFATIRVNARVAAVTVAPAVNTVAVGRNVRLAATVKDAAGDALTDRPVSWTSHK